MALPLIGIPHVDWQRDSQWLGYEIFNGARVPPPHTWQDWIAAILLFGAVLVFFLVVACLGNWWRRDVLGFGGYNFLDWDRLKDTYADTKARLAQRSPAPFHEDLRRNRAPGDRDN